MSLRDRTYGDKSNGEYWSTGTLVSKTSLLGEVNEK